MGFDAGILKDENNPTWYYQEGYDDFLEIWKTSQTPQTWMKYSCLWYSRLLALEMGMDKMQSYLDSFDYGNHDLSGGLATLAWVNSSIEISPKEQASFIKKMVQGILPVSSHALQMTKAILFVEELPEGWKLYGKTGWSGSILGKDGNIMESAWFVGWVEKENSFFTFAYNVRDEKINLSQRIPRVKQLLAETNLQE